MPDFLSGEWNWKWMSDRMGQKLFSCEIRKLKDIKLQKTENLNLVWSTLLESKGDETPVFEQDMWSALKIDD